MTAFVLQLRYLSGRCIATAYNDRERAEWPPHPARVYSSLVAAWAEREPRDEAEERALEWLSGLPAPSMYASEAGYRAVVPHFVPINDVSVLGSFARERTKLVDLENALEAAKAEHENAVRAGDKKALQRAAKSLAKAERALGSERQKVEQRMAADQQPYPQNARPGAALGSAHAMLPEHRGKQPRTFPSAAPHDPRVFLRWAADESETALHASALSELSARVVRVGHSASFVACSVVDDCPMPTWEPTDAGQEVLRVPGPGQLARLVEAFERHQEIEPRVLPCRFQRYARVGKRLDPLVAASAFGDDWIVFRQVAGRRLFQTLAVQVATAMRAALMAYAENPLPELLSGHTSNGEPSTHIHLAFVPLPFVDHPRATGELLGLALIFPRDTPLMEKQAVLSAIGRWEASRREDYEDDAVDAPPLELTLGRAGTVMVERVEWGVAPLKTLRAATWCGPSHAWLTATPIALDRNPGNLRSADRVESNGAFEAAARSIATACERIGLPTPSYVQVHPSVPLSGGAKARAFPAFPTDPRKHQRVKVHARIEFPTPVTGPVLLGAGRYFGLGLCVPQTHDRRVVP